VKRKTLFLAAIALGVPIAATAANFSCAPSNTACLITSIQQANSNGEENDILLEGGVYEFVDFPEGTALPVITGRMRIHGPHANGATISGNGGGRFFLVASGASLTIEWLGLTGGRAVLGGAISNEGILTVTRSALYGNRATSSRANGGAIFSTGRLHVMLTTFSGNSGGDGNGGAISNSNAAGSMVVEDSFFYRNSARAGGAIFNTSVANATILRTTIQENFGEIAGGVFTGSPLWIEASTIFNNGSRNGGGIYNSPLGVLTLVNTTLGENAVDGGAGGAVYNKGRVVSRNATVARNRAMSLGRSAGIHNDEGGSVEILNTILSNNLSSVSAMPQPNDKPSNCSEGITSRGNNIIESLLGCNNFLKEGDQLTDPMIGGFVEEAASGHAYFPLMPGSPAIGSGNDLQCPPLDQSGNARGGRCDVGASARVAP
jgi:hypothetical protein